MDSLRGPIQGRIPSRSACGPSQRSKSTKLSLTEFLQQQIKPAVTNERGNS